MATEPKTRLRKAADAGGRLAGGIFWGTFAFVALLVVGTILGGVYTAVMGDSSDSQIERREDPFNDDPGDPSDAPAEEPEEECDPNYEGACIDPNGGDVDCEGGSGDGPQFAPEVEVVGRDWANLDRDGDGIACEPYD